MNISNPTTFAAPDLTYSTSNSSGTSGALRADDQIAIFSASSPQTIAFSQSAAAGDDAFASRLDHVHGMAAATAEASAAQVKDQTAEALFVPPDHVKQSPGVAKCWGKAAATGVLASPSYNITSSGKDSTGVYTWTWLTDFTDVDYAILVTPYDATAFFNPDTIAVGSTKVRMFDASSVASDRGHSVAGFGDIS